MAKVGDKRLRQTAEHYARELRRRFPTVSSTVVPFDTMRNGRGLRVTWARGLGRPGPMQAELEAVLEPARRDGITVLWNQQPDLVKTTAAKRRSKRGPGHAAVPIPSGTFACPRCGQESFVEGLLCYCPTLPKKREGKQKEAAA